MKNSQETVNQTNFDEKQELHDLNVELETLNKKVTVAREETSKLVSLGAELQTAEQKLTEKNAEVTKVEQKLTETNQAVTLAENKLEETNKKVTEEENKLETTKSAISVGEKAITDLDAQKTQKNTELETLINSLLAAERDHKTAMLGFVEEHATVKQGIEDKKTALGEAKTKLSDILDQIDKDTVKTQDNAKAITAQDEKIKENQDIIGGQLAIIEEATQKSKKILEDAEVGAKKIMDDAVAGLAQERKALNDRSGELSLREHWVQTKEKELKEKVDAIEQAIGRKINVYITPTDYVPKNSPGNG